MLSYSVVHHPNHMLRLLKLYFISCNSHLDHLCTSFSPYWLKIFSQHFVFKVYLITSPSLIED